MAETEQASLQRNHQLAIREAAADSRRGQGYAFLIALVALVAACFLGYVGLEAAATTVGGGTVVGLVTAFIMGRRRK